MVTSKTILPSVPVQEVGSVPTALLSTGKGLTVKVVLEVHPKLSVKVIVVVPALCAVITPPSVMVATAGVALDQGVEVAGVPVVVTVAVPFTHNVVVPVIGGETYAPD